MNKLTLNLNSQLIEVKTGDCRSPAQLSRLIQASFQTKQQILGITDSYGKFYDLQYTWQNLKTLGNHKLNIIVGKQKPDSMSFGSRASQRNRGVVDCKDKCLGKINDIETFRKFQPQGLRIILILKEGDNLKNIPFEYYQAKGTTRWLEIWNNNVLVIDCSIGENHQKLFEGVNIYLSKFMTDNEEMPPDPDDIMDNEAKQSMILQAFEELLQEEFIGELEFYKKKTLILEKPDIFVHRYFTGETIDRSQLIQRIKTDLIKQKEESKFFDFISTSSPKKEIPIFVRKGTNRVEKVSAELPLTIEQQQILNLLLELELKGLITDGDMTLYQKQLLNLNPTLLQLIRDYYQQELDQIELSRRLKKMFRDRAYRRS